MQAKIDNKQVVGPTGNLQERQNMVELTLPNITPDETHLGVLYKFCALNLDDAQPVTLHPVDFHGLAPFCWLLHKLIQEALEGVKHVFYGSIA